MALHHFGVPLETYLMTNPTIKGVIVSAVVLHQGRILLIQRAATDGFPNLWETPGGGVDLGDETLSHALARELLEETGLVLKHVIGLLDQPEFEGASGEGRYRKLTFLVFVEDEDGLQSHPQVVLNPIEHQDFMWASEDDLRIGFCGEREIKLAYPRQRETLFAAFRAGTKTPGRMHGDNGTHKAT
ncbi:NUDIX hydrolase domain-like protein [Pseudoneurospora amorphoporcata]|uniref:NUDIX hydrolase domain-like protein n=1 Tax=Pseudoneurospora amorphoporcata TaxID=241081 RepID=A0AAN6NNB3_9PEZI|nr:NUDIX hydrolase domain-like protein [Pseudoneurospora amorphoporcata]